MDGYSFFGTGPSNPIPGTNVAPTGGNVPDVTRSMPYRQVPPSSSFPGGTPVTARLSGMGALAPLLLQYLDAERKANTEGRSTVTDYIVQQQLDRMNREGAQETARKRAYEQGGQPIYDGMGNFTGMYTQPGDPAYAPKPQPAAMPFKYEDYPIGSQSTKYPVDRREDSRGSLGGFSTTPPERRAQVSKSVAMAPPPIASQDLMALMAAMRGRERESYGTETAPPLPSAPKREYEPGMRG